jgi:hypothetical protein
MLRRHPGAGLLASKDPDTINNGSNIVLGGLGIQVIFFGLFIIASITFEVRMARNPTGKSHTAPWRKHMIMLYITSALILIRSVFRLIEYGQGFHGYLLSHEVYLYIFDALLMLATMLVMNWIHPSEVGALLRGRGKMAQSYRIVEVGMSDMAGANRV